MVKPSQQWTKPEEKNLFFSDRYGWNKGMFSFPGYKEGHWGEKEGKEHEIKKKKRYTRPRRVVAIDPGRVNLIMAYDTSNGKYHRLTRNYYYRACGMKRLVKKLNERNLKRKGIYDAMSRSPTKSIREEDWYAYQLVITRNYDTLWRENATEQRRRENFKVKRLKEKCPDQFLNQWGVKGEEKPLIVYGAASMNPSGGKGELAVPVSWYQETGTHVRTSSECMRRKRDQDFYAERGAHEGASRGEIAYTTDNERELA
jgi:hypothetical protein